MLGFKTCADLVTERRMVKSGSRALSFLEELAGRFKETFEKEKQELIDFKRKELGDSKSELHFSQ